MQRQESQKLGDLIKSAREAKGLSARELAAATGVHHRTIGMLERGEIEQPKAVKLQAMADVLDLDPTDLLTLAGYEPTKRLPGLGVYLRSTTGLPDEAIDELHGYFDYLHAKYGVDPHGPMHGQDETDR